MPDAYNSEKVFNALFVMARDLVKDEVSVATEGVLRKVSDTLADLLVDERKKTSSDHDVLQAKFNALKKSLNTQMAQACGRMAVLDDMVVKATTQLILAKSEIARLKAENKALRVTGTLSKSTRKIRNS
jgi:hypothetical protein